MKKLLTLLPLALAATACQHAAPATRVTAVQSSAPVDTIMHRPTLIVQQPLPSLFTAADTLSRPMRELLKQYDLSALWQSVGHYHDGVNSFEGFFGPDHYHFAMAVMLASRDATDPAVYHITGKSRYRKNIRSFTGTLTMRQVTDLSYPGFLAWIAQRDEKAADSLDGRTYTARARLQLQEEAKENSGLFEGEVLLDFYVVPGQQPGFVGVFAFEGNDDRLPTRGAGLLLRGNCRNMTTGQVKPFTVSPDVTAVAPFVFKDFMLDERMCQINPKYAKLGWNEVWRNDEWWADSPKPNL